MREVAQQDATGKYLTNSRGRERYFRFHNLKKSGGGAEPYLQINMNVNMVTFSKLALGVTISLALWSKGFASPALRGLEVTQCSSADDCELALRSNTIAACESRECTLLCDDQVRQFFLFFFALG